ncbi:MAG: CsgG/HfaB family protein [Trueperaceae bacterium]|jgi:curli biogenesis system outer membrane secretion channel CsgG|nr:CsgG/HfaB family protein [Truepera sp.]
MLRRPIVALIAVATALLGACAPTTEVTAGPAACVSDPIPTVAVVDFQNTSGQGGGVSVVGVEEAATARLITLLKESGCYVIVERSELQTIIEKQGMESLDPVALAKAAGAGYVVTGTVTRATVARPGGSLFGVTLGETKAQIEVDVRATDIVTGEVVVSKKGSGEAMSPNISVSNVPVAGNVSYNDPTVGPLFAEAANSAINQVVAALRAKF